LSDKIKEKDLLDGQKYPWMEGYNPAAVLLGTFSHHNEHYLDLMKAKR